MITLETPVAALNRVGTAVSKQLKKLGIETCRDLIFFTPSRFQDFSATAPIAEVKPARVYTVQGKIVLIANRRSRNRRMIITEALIADDSGQIKAVWFNQPFLIKNLLVGDIVSIAGITSKDIADLQFTSPLYEKIQRTGITPIHTGRIIPLYPIGDRLTQKQFRFLVHQAIQHCKGQIHDFLPRKILEVDKFLPLENALFSIHFPKSHEELKHATDRLKFDELFFMQLERLQYKKELSRLVARMCPPNEQQRENFVAALPFALTESQKKAMQEIERDIARATPMNRLLEGDVGSGKTIVAALSALQVIRAGFQVATMAPTEILAQQHFDTFAKLLSSVDFPCALFTSHANKIAHGGVLQECSKAEIRKKISKGEISCTIGTHALIQPTVAFSSLALVIIDEQHRFGVRQRQVLRNKFGDGRMPHLLSLTATPIPRSLALTLYGDLDISILSEKPRHRKKIITKIVPEEFRGWTYEFVKKQVTVGRQAFVVCPAIDPTDILGVRSVTEEYERLSREEFHDLRSAMLHGKMPQKQKDALMERVLAGEVDVLVATSVIEVGIDVSNASVILIEGAERFGLAQLHQFRGRVGRAQHQSYCFLLPTTKEKKENERLKALMESDNGFELAEKDLALRGEGEVFGDRQSGMPELKLASLFDVELIQKARMYAAGIVDSLENYPVIKERLREFEQGVHLE